MSAAHNAAVTCSVFAPNPDLILEQLRQQQQQKEEAAQAQTLDFDALSSFSSAPSSPPPPPTAGAGSVASAAPAAAASTPFDRSKSVMSATGASIKDRLGSVSLAGTPQQQTGYVVISGDYDGNMNVFVNISKPRHSSFPSPSIKPYPSIT